MANLFNRSGQTFKTQITEFEDPTVTIDASSFTEAIYRIYDAQCTTVLVEKKLSVTGEIIVIADVDAAGNPINVFKTTLLKTDMTMAAGQFTHQFRVVNTAGLNLPPVFQELVQILEVCD